MTDKYTDMQLRDFQKEAGKPTEPEVTMPDFHKWAIEITGLHCVYRLVGTQEALQQAFDQGVALGRRQKVPSAYAFNGVCAPAFIREKRITDDDDIGSIT